MLAEALIRGGDWLVVGLAALIALLAGRTWGRRETPEQAEARATAEETERRLRERASAAEQSKGLLDRHAARRVAEELVPRPGSPYRPHVERIQDRLKEHADEEDAKAAEQDPFAHTGS